MNFIMKLNIIFQEKVKEALGKICAKFPSIENSCEEFVKDYGDAIVAILAQEIDPSQVNIFITFRRLIRNTKYNISNVESLFKICPMIHICPSKELLQLWEIYSIKDELKDKSTCPLCLLAVTQIYNVIRNNKTEVRVTT